MTTEVSLEPSSSSTDMDKASNSSSSSSSRSKTVSMRVHSISSLLPRWMSSSSQPSRPRSRRNRHHEEDESPATSMPTTGENVVKVEAKAITKTQAETFVTILSGLDVLMTISSTFICSICHSFLIDTCLFPCGHMFCKFCGLSWLRLESTCPVCGKETFSPFTSRCYEMDSVIEEFYPVLEQFYSDLAATKEGRTFVRLKALQEPLPESPVCVESIQEMRRQMESSSSKKGEAVCIHSVEDREKLRRHRRSVSERKDILLGAPCTSMLQKLGTLGWGTTNDDQSISMGMRSIVWFCLCYTSWNFWCIFQHPIFEGGLRTLIYAAVVLVALNSMQMHLFMHPDEAPNLLNFGLWEWDYVRTGLGANGEGDGGAAASESSSAGSTASRNSSSSGDRAQGSSDSFKDADDGEKMNGQRELEQMMQWRKEGSLELDKVFKMASEIMEAFDELRRNE